MADKPYYMKWCPKDWSSDPRVQAMDRMARYGYFEILNALWMAGGVLADDEKTLMASSKLTKKLWQRHRSQIRSMLLECSPGMTAGIPQEYRGSLTGSAAVTQKRLLLEYEAAAKLQEAKSRGGKKRKDSTMDSHKDSTMDSSKSPGAISESESESEKELRSFSGQVTFSGGLPDDAFEQILAAYPRKNASDGRSAFRNVVAGLNPMYAREWHEKVLAAAQVCAQFPRAKQAYLPNLGKFISGAWEDDWANELKLALSADSVKPRDEQATREELRRRHLEDLRLARAKRIRAGLPVKGAPAC